MKELIKKSYVDSKTKYVVVNVDVGNHNVDLSGVQCVIINLQGNSNETITLTFITTSYIIDTNKGVSITVNFNINEITVNSLPTGFKLKSYLLIY